ncbi:MAG: hypothetical protein R2883_04635 [Caldisericia bacterium]
MISQSQVILKSQKSDATIIHEFTDVPIGSNNLGWLLSDVPRDLYNVTIRIGEDITESAPLYIEENLLDWSNVDFKILSQSEEFLIMEVE